jgi:hypothetical protein
MEKFRRRILSLGVVFKLVQLSVLLIASIQKLVNIIAPFLGQIIKPLWLYWTNKNGTYVATNQVINF